MVNPDTNFYGISNHPGKPLEVLTKNGYFPDLTGFLVLKASLGNYNLNPNGCKLLVNPLNNKNCETSENQSVKVWNPIEQLSMVHLSTTLSMLVEKSGQAFSRRKFFNLRGNPCLKLDCVPSCDEYHIHGKVLPCPEDKSRFIESLDQLESVPSDTKILKTAEDLLKSYEASHDGKAAYISWPGYWIEKFAREDITILIELVNYVGATKSQFPREERLMENECTTPPGLASLNGRQEKFVQELWHKR